MRAQIRGLRGYLELVFSPDTDEETLLLEFFEREAIDRTRRDGPMELVMKRRVSGPRHIMILGWMRAKPKRYGDRKETGLMYYIRNFIGNMVGSLFSRPTLREMELDVVAKAKDKDGREREAAKLADMLEGAVPPDSEFAKPGEEVEEVKTDE